MKWIAVDWGGSNLRAWLMEDAQMLAAASDGTAGANALEPAAFEPALTRLITPWDLAGADVMVCGVAGAREGWQEAPYARVPCKPGQIAPMPVATRAPELRVHIVPGVSQTAPRPAVMRGEETQITGFLADHPSFDGVLCLPGTHTKWARISAGEIVSFDGALTGEMFQLLAGKSILRHSVRPGPWDGAAFDGGLSETLSRPERLMTAISDLRADDVLNKADPQTAHARLSGLLVGAEIAALKPYWLGQAVAIIGAETLCAAYARALTHQGVTAESFDAASLTRAGLWAALQSLGPTT